MADNKTTEPTWADVQKEMKRMEAESSSFDYEKLPVILSQDEQELLDAYDYLESIKEYSDTPWKINNNLVQEQRWKDGKLSPEEAKRYEEFYRKRLDAGNKTIEAYNKFLEEAAKKIGKAPSEFTYTDEGWMGANDFHNQEYKRLRELKESDVKKSTDNY